MDTPAKLKARLLGCIDDLARHAHDFARRPGADFTRRRKVGFADLLQALVCMGTRALGFELGECLAGPSPPSAAAFCQQRAKLDPEALHQLLLAFEPDVPAPAPFAGRLRLVAVDGTDVEMQRNPRDALTFDPRSNGSEVGRNSVHATALYDLCGERFLDAVVQPGPGRDEHAAFRQMADRCGGPGVVFVGDRGFFGYNDVAHCAESGASFVIRLTDARARSLSGFDRLPDALDVDVPLALSRSRSARARSLPGYRHLSRSVPFDYLPDDDAGASYRLDLRIVRVALDDGSFENLATNLPRGEFGPAVLREVYAMRWGIETSFRDLKYTIGLAMLHSSSFRGAAQETYARMVLYNFCSAMAALAALLVPERPGAKHERAVNFANAARVCAAELRSRDGPADDALARIAASTCPVRPGRSHARRRSRRTRCSFAYRG